MGPESGMEPQNKHHRHLVVCTGDRPSQRSEARGIKSILDETVRSIGAVKLSKQLQVLSCISYFCITPLGLCQRVHALTQVISPQSHELRTARLHHVLRSVETSFLTAVLGHAGGVFIFLALGHLGLGLGAYVILAGLDLGITARSRALRRGLGSKTNSNLQRTEAELAVMAVTRSILIAAILFLMMKTQGPAGAFFPLALLGIICSGYIFQLVLAPKTLLAACLPLLACLIIGAAQVLSYLPPVAVWVTVATMIGGFCWIAIYSFQTQSRTLNLIRQSREAQCALQTALADAQSVALVREQLEREVGIGFYEVDVATAATSWSSGVHRIYGLPETAPVPSIDQIAARIADGRGPALAKDYLRGVFKGMTVVQNYPVNTFDGRKRHIRTIAVPQHDASGAITRLSGALIDETDQARHVEAVEAVERRLRAALAVGASVLWEHDLVAGTSFSLGAVEHFLQTDNVNNDVLDLILARIEPDDLPLVMATVKESAKLREPRMIEHRMIVGGNDAGWVRTTLVGKFRTDGPGYALITALSTDITDEVHKRQVLAKALDDAQAGSRAKSSFLANMSHEIRTPLHGIIAVGEMLGRTELSAEQREMVSLVQSSGHALSAVVNDVLDLARVESGRLEIATQPVEIAAVIEASAGLFQARAVEKGIELSLEVQAGAGLVVESDPVRLGQIVSNLVSNAVKFTEKGSVSVKLVCDVAECTTGSIMPVKVSITDTGPGISPAHLTQLFNRFEQLDGSITREHGGSGLGLAIVQSLAELMGGAVTVESEVGMGSTFTLSLGLPLVSSGDVEHGVVEDTTYDTGPLRILAADDHPTNRQVLKLVLSQLDVDLTLCVNGQEAVDAYQAGSFDLVLMDLQMPVMDGLTALRQIREFERTAGRARIPAAAVTANAMEHHRIEAIEAGADIHISKPYTPDQLIEAIEQLLDVAAAGDAGQYQQAV
jgi:signal transduction histidine kinase/ActR/RegA family two-component response regulator